MNDSILRKIQVYASFGLILSVPAVAAASQQSFDENSGALRVTYADLDLTSAAGVEVLYGRLQQASAMACDTGSRQQKGSIKASRAAADCYDEVLNNLVSKVANSKLTAMHES